ncbi:MAG: hypothetical protein ACRD2U_16330 [Terriglobales bacterium]
MKLFLLGGFASLLIVMLMTVGYFSLATLFAANAKFLEKQNHPKRTSLEKESSAQAASPEMEFKAEAATA